MRIKINQRNIVGTLMVGAAALLSACGADASAVSAPTAEHDRTVVWVDFSCVVHELADDARQVFEEACLYEGRQRSDLYPAGLLRERVVDGDSFTSSGSDGSVRAGTCLGEYLEEYPRAAERDAGVLPHTPAVLEGHEWCTFTGSFVGINDRAGQELVEEGSMYRASATSYRGRIAIRPAR